MKVDNGDMAAKLLLRKHLLDKYHSQKAFIALDCCEGDGHIWDALSRRYDCVKMGVDKKKKKGRIAVDSREVLRWGPMAVDVVDIDTYGCPWGHWIEVLKWRQPSTVFLTVGMVTTGGGNVSNVVRKLMGWEFNQAEVPSVLGAKFSAIIPERMIALASDFGLAARDVVKAKSRSSRAEYYGVRLEIP